MRSIEFAAGLILVLGAAAPAAFAGDDLPAGRPPGDGDRVVLDAPAVAAVTTSGRAALAGTLALLAADEPPAAPPPRVEPGVEVEGRRPSEQPEPVLEYPAGGGWSPTGLAEDTRLGPAGQPEWTTERRWARVRSYVIAPGQIELESWYRGRYHRHGDGQRHIFQEEIGLGLPHRFQFDFYLNFQQDDPGRDLHFQETQVELRYAFADWGCLPANPTLYLEYRLHDDPSESDAYEVKLLLSDDLGCRWRWGANLTYEREVKGEEEEVFGTTAAISYTVVDQRFSVGAEFQWERATVESSRNDPENTFYLGPSVQFRLGSGTHLDIAPLFGLNDASEKMQLFIVLGIDISPNGTDGGWLNPISAQSR